MMNNAVKPATINAMIPSVSQIVVSTSGKADHFMKEQRCFFSVEHVTLCSLFDKFAAY